MEQESRDAKQGEAAARRFSMCGEPSSAMHSLRTEEPKDAEASGMVDTTMDVAELSAALDVTNRLMESLVKRVSCEFSLMHLMIRGNAGDMEETESESDSDSMEDARLPASQTTQARKKLFGEKTLYEWFNEQKHLLSMNASVVPAKSPGGLLEDTRRRPVLDAATSLVSAQDQSSFHLSEMRLGDIEAQLMKLITVAAADQVKIDEHTISTASSIERLETLSELYQSQCRKRSESWGPKGVYEIGDPPSPLHASPDHANACPKVENRLGSGNVDHTIVEVDDETSLDVHNCLTISG